VGGRRWKKTPLIPQPYMPPQPTELVKLEASAFSGPLPHPDLLAKFNEIIPDGAERIMAMAERQSAHREKQENRVIDGNVRSQTRGSYFGFILSLVAILGGLFLLYQGKNIAGLGAIISSIAPLAAVFFVARRAQENERADKAAALQARRSR